MFLLGFFLGLGIALWGLRNREARYKTEQKPKNVDYHKKSPTKKGCAMPKRSIKYYLYTYYGNLHQIQRF